jgi:L-ascorbate metabolism protein UlaG (beta-lactamase superfamily)
MTRFRRILKRMAIILVTLIALIAITTVIIMQLPQFGKAPSGQRLERIKNSPNYKNGKFQNRIPTPIIPEGYTMTGEVIRTFFGKNPRKFPTDSFPSVKTDLKALPKDSNVLVWFGHSSYFMQVNGKRILVDPVLMGSASPLPFGVKAFRGTDIYTPDEIPEIDYLLISHDHFDHLDYKTIMALKHKIKNVICGLGVGEHFEYWGFNTSQIIEKDWNETVAVDENFKIHTAPARHGSGRKIQRDNTLWLSFIIDAPATRIYVGGDSGYDTHFAELGKKYGSFDLAILDNGQYSNDWNTIHMPPKYAIQAAKDLNAKRLFPVHTSKFVLARHPWDEPLVQIAELSITAKMPLVTPMIGEPVQLSDKTQIFKQWWQGLN